MAVINNIDRVSTILRYFKDHPESGAVPRFALKRLFDFNEDYEVSELIKITAALGLTNDTGGDVMLTKLGLEIIEMYGGFREFLNSEKEKTTLVRKQIQSTIDASEISSQTIKHLQENNRIQKGIMIVTVIFAFAGLIFSFLNYIKPQEVYILKGGVELNQKEIESNREKLNSIHVQKDTCVCDSSKQVFF